MFNRGLILKKAAGSEDRLLLAKVLDRAERADKTGKGTCSDFLDPHQKNMVESALSSIDDIEYSFFGGYVGAEREIVIFGPAFISEDYSDIAAEVLKAVNITTGTCCRLNHRDYLGALMGLGIKREKVGDILVNASGCSIIVLSEVSEYIESNLFKVGNVKVSVKAGEIGGLDIPQPKTREIKTTVASLRLDSVTGAGFGMPRSKVADYIRAERVSLNWQVETSLDKQVREGDTISFKGKGRVVLESAGHITKKGRVGVILKKMV